MSGKTYLIGIDFGTYYTKISYIHLSSEANEVDPEPRPLNLKNITDSEGLIPSFICDDFIGQKALDIHRSKGFELYRNFKTQIHTKEGQDLILKFLSIIYQEIRKQLGNVQMRFKFALPAGWKKVGEKAEIYRELIQKAGFDLNGTADNENIFLSEPYASAAFFLRKGEGLGNYLVIDAGAGTIDCSVVSITKVHGKILIEEKENTLDSFEEAGYFVDSILRDVYKLDNPSTAEELKIKASRAFTKGKDEFFLPDPPIIAKKDEFYDCLKNWLNNLEKFLSQYVGLFDKGNILLTGGFSNFYFLREKIQEIFNQEKLLPQISTMNTLNQLQFAVSFGCVLELIGFIETVELVNYSIKIPIYYSFADLVKEVKYFNKSLNFEILDTRTILIEVISPNEIAGSCGKRLSDIRLILSSGTCNLSLKIITTFLIIAEDNQNRRETDDIKIHQFEELEPQDYEILVDKDHIPKLKVIGKNNTCKVFEFRKFTKEFKKNL